MPDSIDTQISAARAELEHTLDAIGDKLNAPKRLRHAALRARRSFNDNPLPWIIGASAALVAVGGIIALSVASRRR